MAGKRFCTIQVDADGLWVIRRLLGEPAPIDPDPVFETGIGRLLGLFDEFGVKATFFVVGRDLESPAKVRLLRDVIGAGHEIASHGMDHLYLSGLDAASRREEIISSKGRIESALGVGVAGFKCAGFAAHKDMVKDLAAAGYRYDSSVFGTSLAFLMQAASGVAYPKLKMAASSNKPYRPAAGDIFKRGSSALVEIPVTAMPFVRLPMHFSYAILGGGAYAALAMGALRVSGARFVNYLFHPLDMVDSESVHIEGGVHGLAVRSSVKEAMARRILSTLVTRYEAVTSKQMCEELKGLV